MADKDAWIVGFLQLCGLYILIYLLSNYIIYQKAGSAAAQRYGCIVNFFNLGSGSIFREMLVMPTG